MSKVLVIGAQLIDIFTYKNKPYILKDSNIADVSFSYGGVGRNMATNLARLEADVSFLTVFGDDLLTLQAKASLEDLGINLQGSKQSNRSNGVYLGILDPDNDLYLGINDTKIIKELDLDYMKSQLTYMNTFDYIVIDTNLEPEVITFICENTKGKTFLDAVSAHKVSKLRNILHHIDYLKCNQIELEELTQKKTFDDQIDFLRKENANTVIITNQEKDIKVYKKEITSYKTIPIDHIVNATGAGDGFISGFIKGITQNKTIEEAIEIAKRVAYITMLSKDATASDLTYEKVKNFETIFKNIERSTRSTRE